MVLIGVRLFLRYEEIIDLRFFILMKENAIYDKDGTIAGLFVQILGKTEKQHFSSRDYDNMAYSHSSVVMSC